MTKNESKKRSVEMMLTKIDKKCKSYLLTKRKYYFNLDTMLAQPCFMSKYYAENIILSRKTKVILPDDTLHLIVTRVKRFLNETT